MEPIVTVQQMRQLEATADALGVSYATMMQRAGHAVADALATLLPDLTNAPVLILIGPGNNGGDGLVAAVALAQMGAIPKCYFLAPPDEDNPQVQAARTANLFIADFKNDLQQRVLKHLVASADAIIDALFGTGLRLPLRQAPANLLRTVHNRLKDRPIPPVILAVDCPTGLDCDTGAVDPHTLTCDLTVTFGAFKPGHFLFPGADHTGNLRLASIGWPDDLPGLTDIPAFVPDDADIAARLPRRPLNSHKGTFGRALAVAGSVNYTGAAYLAASAAYRAGAGLVTLATPPDLHPALAGVLPEVTWLLLASDMGVLARAAADQVRAALPAYDALLLGPGWGSEHPTAEFLSTLLTTASPPRAIGLLGSTTATASPAPLPPTVVDADGLRLLAQLPNWPSLLPALAILTPHPGEMAALTGLTPAQIQADRLNLARQFAAEWGHVIILKGAFTVVAAPTGQTAVLPFANSALATAGTGDVLAGLCLGFLAQGLPAFDAALCAGYLHALAGEIATDALGHPAPVLARDLLTAFPDALTTVLE